jgi:hypothetical protein
VECQSSSEYAAAACTVCSRLAEPAACCSMGCITKQLGGLSGYQRCVLAYPICKSLSAFLSSVTKRCDVLPFPLPTCVGMMGIHYVAPVMHALCVSWGSVRLTGLSWCYAPVTVEALRCTSGAFNLNAPGAWHISTSSSARAFVYAGLCVQQCLTQSLSNEDSRFHAFQP